MPQKVFSEISILMKLHKRHVVFGHLVVMFVVLILSMFQVGFFFYYYYALSEVEIVLKYIDHWIELVLDYQKEAVNCWIAYGKACSAHYMFKEEQTSLSCNKDCFRLCTSMKGL